MENRNTNTRNFELLIFVILIVVFGSCIVAFLYIPRSCTQNTSDDLVIALAPNIIASIISFSVAYYIFSVRGIRLRDSTSDEITQKLDALLEIERSIIKFRSSEHESIDDFFKKIQHQKLTNIDLVGYSMAHIFQRYRKELKKRVEEGTKVRVLILDPDSKAGDLMIERVGDENLVLEPHERTIRYIKNINSEIQGSSGNGFIEVKKMAWIPSVTVIMSHNNFNFFSILLGVNGFILDNTIERRIYTVSVQDIRDDKFQFFESHFERMWTKSSDIKVNQ